MTLKQEAPRLSNYDWMCVNQNYQLIKFKQKISKIIGHEGALMLSNQYNKI
jgi:hypothetical protein